MTETDKKEALKQARAARADYIKAAAAASKQQKAELAQLNEQLANGPATPVELAQATGLAADRVMWLLASMRKYGQVVEAEKQGDYFSYKPVPSQDDAEACD